MKGVAILNVTTPQRRANFLSNHIDLFHVSVVSVLKTKVHSSNVTAPAARGVRSIAIFEAFKGLLVLLVGLGLLHFLHHDVQSTAEELVRHAHLNPAHHYPQIFIEAARHTNDTY